VHKGWIVGMHVAAEHQGNGYGRALLVAALERARTIPRLELVQLGVESKNKQAMSLYSSLGFKTYGVEKRAVLVDGEYFDEDLMALELV
jgi:RimJ/RimL family protein N-acetyltransferase